MVDFDELYDFVEDFIDDGASSFIIIVFASEGEILIKNVYVILYILVLLMGSVFVKCVFDCDDEIEFWCVVFDYVRDSIILMVAFDCDFLKICFLF